MQYIQTTLLHKLMKTEMLMVKLETYIVLFGFAFLWLLSLKSFCLLKRILFLIILRFNKNPLWSKSKWVIGSVKLILESVCKWKNQERKKI